MEVGARVRVREGVDVDRWLTQCLLTPPEKHQGKVGTIENSMFDVMVLDGWGACYVAVVRMDGEDIPRFFPHPCLEAI